MTRLAPMMRKYLTMTLALLAGAACAVVLASCGGGGTLSGATAQQLLDALDKMQTEASEGNCSTVASDASNVSSQVQARSDIDPKLRAALVEGFDNLAQLAVSDGCESTTTSEPTTTESTTTEETTTETTTTPDTVPTRPQTTSTPTQTQTQTQTTPTNPTGGTPGASGGISP